MPPKKKMESPWYPPSVIETGNGDQFKWHEGGHYECVVHDSYTCEEVEKLYASGQDASVLYDMISESQRTKFGDFCVFVPISFHPVMEVVVNLVPLEKMEGAAFVYLEQMTIPDDTWYRWSEPFVELSDLGMIAPGDSAKTIVSMLDNHLAITSFDVTNCPSSTHSFAQQMYLASNLEDRASRRLEKWSQFLYGMCIACKTDPQALNFEDLIPQKEGRPF